CLRPARQVNAGGSVVLGWSLCTTWRDPGCDPTRLEDDRARLRFTGTFEAIKELKDEPQMSYRGVASATGMAVYDVKYKRMTSLLLYFRLRPAKSPSSLRGRTRRSFGRVPGSSGATMSLWMSSGTRRMVWKPWMPI